MSEREAPNHKQWRAHISDNLEYLKGNGPFRILTTYELEEDEHQVIILDKDSNVINIDPQPRVYETVTQALQDVLRRTSLMVQEKCRREQDEEMRPEDTSSDEGDRSHEASFPGVNPGGLFDPKPHAHFRCGNDSNRQRPPHIPLHGTGPLRSGGMFGPTPSGGLFGNSADTQGQPTGSTAGQSSFAFGPFGPQNTQSQPTPRYYDMFGNQQGQPTGDTAGQCFGPFGTNNNPTPYSPLYGSSTNGQSQPTPCLFGNNNHPQGQPIGACKTPFAIPPGNRCTNRAAGGLFGHCPSGQGLFGCNGNANEPSGAYDPHPYVSCLPASHGLFAHPSGCNTTVTVNLNGLTVSGPNSSGRDRSKTNVLAGSNNQNNNNANNQSNNVHRFRPGRRGLWSSPFSPAGTHAHVARGSIFGPSAPRSGLFSTQPGKTDVAADTLFGPYTRDKPQRLFERSPIFPATPGPVTTSKDRKVPRGGLFGAQPDASTDVRAKDKSNGGLFGQYTVVPDAHADTAACDGPRPSLFSGPGPKIEAAADPKTPKPETFGPRIAAPGESLFGSAHSKSKDTRLVEPSAVAESESRPADLNKRAHFSATVEDASSLSDTEKSSINGNNKWKGKAVSRLPHSTEPANTKKRVSPEPSTPASAPAAKKDAASSGSGLMGSPWAEAAKHAGHTSTVSEADNKSSGEIPELSSVGAAMRAAAEQTASVPDDPRSMFASKAVPSGVSNPETTTTQQSPAPSSLFSSAPGSTFAPAPATVPAPTAPGPAFSAPAPSFSAPGPSFSAPGSMFAPAPSPAPAPSAPGPAPAPSSFAPSPFAPGAPSFAGPSFAGPSFAGPSFAGPSFAGPSFAGPSFAGSSFAGPSFAGPSVPPTVVPEKESVEKSLEEPVKEAVKDSAETVQKPATDSSTQSSTAQKPAAEKTKKAKFGGLFDSKYAS
ncbi:hypothetical protein KCU65_g3411, partial [Aureobasidium melanogenum]